MLFVRTKLGPSFIHGIGCFAAEPIAKFTLIWLFDEELDQRYTEEKLFTYPKATLEWFYHNMWLSKISNYFVMHGDNARFVNSSERPNVRIAHDPGMSPEYIGIANRDIATGEELTWRYSDFDRIDTSPDSVWCRIEQLCGITPDEWEGQFTK